MSVSASVAHSSRRPGPTCCRKSRGVAAVGAVYTLATHRGLGLGRAVTVGVIDRIADRVETIGLNVAAENAPARRIYESIGFERVVEYEEAELAALP